MLQNAGFAAFCTVVLLWSGACFAAPAGFKAVHTAEGVVHYKKDYAGGQPDHVIVVDLTKAHVRSFFGAIKPAGNGPLGGPNPHIQRQSLGAFWNQAKAANSKAFAVVNAQFFSTNANPTPLAFSVKAAGQVVSDGYGIKSEFVGQMRLLQANGPQQWARIIGFSEAELEGDAAPEMVAILDKNANKGVNTKTGRTFLGVRDANGDGKGETLYVFCTKFASQVDAAKVLSDFGATQMGMVDGGGSSQLIVQGQGQVTSSRTIPHVLAVISGPAPNPPPIIEIVSKTSAKDFRQEGPSKGIADAYQGDEFDVDVLVRCKKGGGPTADHVRIGYWLQKPWLELVTYRIDSDWPHGDEKTWTKNDADGFASNPKKKDPPTSGQLDISSMSPGETKRVRLRVRANQYSLGAVDHPDVRAWIWHVGNYYGEQTGWDDKVETNKAGKILRTVQQTDVFGRTFWRFNGAEKETEGWHKGGDIGELKVNTTDHCLAVKGNGGDPWIQSDKTAFAAKDYKGFKLRVRTTKGPHKSQLHWTTSADGQWTGSKSSWFQVPSDGKFHELSVLVADKSGWKGTITRVRIDPSLGSTAWYDIDWLRADATVTGTSGDADLDGWLAMDDCNDNDKAVHPKAQEACNGKDDNCNGKTDEGCPVADAGGSGSSSGGRGHDAGGKDVMSSDGGDGVMLVDVDRPDALNDGGGLQGGDAARLDGPADLPGQATVLLLKGPAADSGCAVRPGFAGDSRWFIVGILLAALALLARRRRAA